MEKEILEVRIDDIIPNRFQPREKFDEKGLNELAHSIREYGIIQPLVLRKIGDKYEIVAGERRFKAATLAGLNTVPAIITTLGDSESAEIALIENIQRQDLTPIEEARTYQKILELGDMTQEQLATKVGKTQSTVANKLRLLGLDEEVQEALLNNQISERHARALLSLPSKEEQRELLDKIITNRMNVRDTDLEIKNRLGIDPKQQEPAIEIIGEDDEEDDTSEGMAAQITGQEEIEKIKAAAQDINTPHSTPDMNSLLQTPRSEDSERVVVQSDMSSIPETGERKNRFFMPFEEEANMDMGTNAAPAETTLIETPEMAPITQIEPSSEEIPMEPTHHLSTEVEESPEISESGEPATGRTFQDLRRAINIVRDCANQIEQIGFKVDSEEFDFEKMYQVIIKINKD
ncbi:MAG: ParB/RepB/Spo0J family partition protein [Bacilli bacterium]|jgi:ParB family chromosome partitioning protein